MADIRPFPCVLPAKEYAHRAAALPYDVYDRQEAREAALADPVSFLNIDRPESNLPEDTDMYSAEVYAKGRELLDARFAEGIYEENTQPCYYIYELIRQGRSQKGLVACASVDDYDNGVIRKNENVLLRKAQDRIDHMEALEAQTGPIFLAYRRDAVITEIMAEAMAGEKLYGFTTEDGITHNVWRIEDPGDIAEIREAFGRIDSIYIADGHHRTASAAEVCRRMRERHPGCTGEEEFNRFLAVLFAGDELQILPYNRVVRDLNGLTGEQFLTCLERVFVIEKKGTDAVCPEKKGVIGLFLEDSWYRLKVRPPFRSGDALEGLDVSILQKYVLDPILGIKDPGTDPRIGFIGGIRGPEELERRVRTDMKAAFSMYPTSIEEMFRVSDEKRLMPPKSTWFEPKLRSGIFIHRI